MNYLKVLFALYGLGVSTVAGYGLLRLDMPALEHAVRTGSERAELRHRINVAAEGNWFLLGNLITVCSLASLRGDTKDDRA